MASSGHHVLNYIKSGCSITKNKKGAMDDGDNCHFLPSGVGGALHGTQRELWDQQAHF